jgi:hypothetical protein
MIKKTRTLCALLSACVVIGLAGCASTPAVPESPVTSATTTSSSGSPSSAITPCAQSQIQVRVDHGKAVAIANCQGGLSTSQGKSLTVHIGQRVYVLGGNGNPLLGGVTSDTASVATGLSKVSSVLAVGVGTTDVRAESGVRCTNAGRSVATTTCVLLRLTVKE